MPSQPSSAAPSKGSTGSGDDDSSVKSRRRAKKELEGIYTALEAICKVRASRQKLAERQDRTSAAFERESKVLEASYRDVAAKVARVRREVMMVPQPPPYATKLQTVLGEVSDLANKKHDNDRHTCAAITLGKLKKLRTGMDELEEDQGEGGLDTGDRETEVRKGSMVEDMGNNDSLAALERSSQASSRSNQSRRQPPPKTSKQVAASHTGPQHRGPQLLDALEDLTALKGALEKLLSCLTRIIDCKQNLKKVKAAAYLRKYETTLADELTAKEEIVKTLNALSTRFHSSSEHQQLLSVVLSAQEEAETSLDVLQALKADISEHLVKLGSFIRKESTSRYGRLPAGGSKARASSTASAPDKGNSRPASKESAVSSSGSLRSAAQQILKSARSVDSLGSTGEDPLSSSHSDTQKEDVSLGLGLDLSLVGRNR